tara:strand:- start:309 stop:989 length:681 start_codon:yes stop_codon:yes gene_type:complete
MKFCVKCFVKDVKLYNTFGKLKCKKCIDKDKTGKKGHSGMIYKKDVVLQVDMFLNELSLKLVKKSNNLFVKWYIEHYPKSKGIVGRQLNYIIYLKNMPIGIISGASPPLNYKKFRNFYNIKNDLQILNNNVFRLVNKPDDKNIGTKILKLFRQKLKNDYKKKYNENLLGIVTFVEPPRTGAIYKADNWFYLGLTKGIEVRRKGDNWFQKEYSKGTKKHIFCYKYKQ